MVADVAVEKTIAKKSFIEASLTRLGPFIGLFLVIATFAILTGSPERFLSPFNLRIVLAQTVIVAIGAIGMTVIIISGGIDLSPGSTIALTGVASALAFQAGWPPLPALTAAVPAGGIVDLATAPVTTTFPALPF